tara:strand:+ start:314 stop:736 length:423 start_codon:yes stop_codon:yes gene_type:complete
MTNSNSKGKRAEREAAAALQRVFGVACRRSQQYAGGTDSADVIGVDGVHVEVKHQERMRLFDWVEQAVRDCGQNVPVVLHKQNRKPWLITIQLDDVPRFVDTIAKNEAIANHTLCNMARVVDTVQDQSGSAEHQATVRDS